MKFYKIRRKSDGLFSRGGMCPRFNRVGKTWPSIGHLKNHLRQNPAYAKLDDIEVVECETVVHKATSLMQFMADLRATPTEYEKRRARQQERYDAERKRERELREKAISKLDPEERKALGLP